MYSVSVTYIFAIVAGVLSAAALAVWRGAGRDDTGRVRLGGGLYRSHLVRVGRQPVVAVGRDAVVLFARFLYRVHVDDSRVEVT